MATTTYESQDTVNRSFKTIIETEKMIRILVGVLVFTATMVSYILRVSFNIAIVTMTDNVTDFCSNQTDSTISYLNEDGHRRFCWSESQKGWAKSAFFFGYIVLQIHGGTLAEKFGTKRVLGLGLLLTAIFTLLTPLAAVWNLWALFIVRLLIGVSESVTFPVLPPLIQKWVPEHEKSKFIAFSYSGGSLGTVITFPICGYILAYLDWEAVFYISGGFSTAWCIFWFLLMSDDPKDHKCISPREISFIERHRSHHGDASRGKSMPPYWQIIKTPALWVNIFCDFANGWGLFTILTDGPNFIKNVLGQSIEENGWYNSAPHLMSLIMSVLFGIGADFCIAREYFSKPVTAKICQVFGFGGPALALAIMTFVTDDFGLCLAILTVGFGLRGGTYSGHMKSIQDLTKNYSGTVYGFSNGIGSISGIITPLVTAALTEGNTKDPANWRVVFFISTGLYFCSLFAYIFFAKFEPQEFDTYEARKKVES